MPLAKDPFETHWRRDLSQGAFCRGPDRHRIGVKVKPAFAEKGKKERVKIGLDPNPGYQTKAREQIFRMIHSILAIGNRFPTKSDPLLRPILGTYL